MNNDNLHLNKYSNQFNFCSQNINGSMNTNDDSCIDLLEMINMDDNSSNIVADVGNICPVGSILDGGESREDDRCYQEIMSALEKKDFQRIATLALSQSQGGQKMGVILNETMLAIEKSTAVDTNIIEKITSIIRAQPKSSSSVLRATVAPIRNESVVSSSSTSIANYAAASHNPGPKSSSKVSRCTVSQDVNEHDWHALFSPESKSDLPTRAHGARSLPTTSPGPQVPSRPLSSSCVPHNITHGDSRRLTSTEVGQGTYSPYQQPQPGSSTPMSFVQFSNQAGPMMLAGNYVPHSQVSQVSQVPQMQYQQSFISNNGIVCIVTPSLPGEHGTGTQSVYPATVAQTQPSNYPFLMPQNVLISVPGGTPSTQSCQSLSSTCPMSSDTPRTSPSGAITATSTAPHCSNLPRILPKPGNRIIAPKTQFSQQYATQPSQQPQQQFKRPAANRRSSVRPKSGKSGRSSKAKDNIMMAWEIAEQSLFCEEPPTLGHSFLTQLEVEGEDVNIPRGSDSLSETYDNIDHLNIFANLEDLLEGLSETQSAHVTVKETVVDGVCNDYIVHYGRAHSLQVAPLFRAMITTCPISHRSISVISKNSTVSEESLWPTTSNTRMVQLLYAHLGRHSGLLSPLLKCLMPSENHELSGPLSVSTRISEQEDLMNEEDLLADISPVKRDPSHLANLDRLLESCQPPSIASTCSSTSIVMNTRRTRVPFQPTEDSLTLQAFTGSRDCLSWLRRGKHKNKWMSRGSVVRSNRTLEVPDVTERSCASMLRKKSNFASKMWRQRRSVPCETRSVKYLRRLRHVRRVNRLRRAEGLPTRGQVAIEQSVVKESSSGLLKIRIHLAAPDLAGVIKVQSDRGFISSIKSGLLPEVKMKAVAPVTNTSEPEPPSDKAGPLVVKDRSVSPLTIKADYLDPAECKENRTEDSIRPKTESVALLPNKTDNGAPATMKTDYVFTTAVIRNEDLLSVKQNKLPKKSTAKKPRRERSHSSIRQTVGLCRQSKKSDTNTKRIFCTRKEDRRSSVLHTQGPSSSPTKQRHSPAKRKHSKISTENPPLIMKLCSKKSDVAETEEPLTQTSDSIKLLIKRNGHCTYMSQISSVQPPIADSASEEAYQYSPAVNLAPPSQHRSRPQQAVLQFSPAHSTSDSDVGVGHNEISSLLQRQEQREPLSGTSTINQTTFPSLPVPYLIGSDPTVFMDPHEVELVVVKNSRYKKVSQRGTVESQGPTNLFPDTNNSEVFVPGCFVEQDKACIAWSRSSPSMPVLAPQEPFTLGRDVGKSTHSSQPPAYSQSTSTQQSQPYSDPPDRVQQSPLCMTTNPLNSQYSSSSQIDIMPPDPIKSPYRLPSYHYQPSYNSSCYLGDPGAQTMVQPSASSSKSQMQSPPVPLQSSVNNACTSQLPDYSYFHNSSQQALQSLVSAESALFSMTESSSNYQPNSEATPAKSSSKRSSSRNQSCEQASSKKRKEAASLSALSMYPNNSELYSAAAHYSGLDYYGSGFSNILGNIDQMKIYEQYAREYSMQLGQFCPTGMPWSSAMAEYCKQAVALTPQASSSSGASGAPLGLASSNPLSLSSNVLPGVDYANSYTAYAMSQPYSMYSTFGMPK